MGITRPLAALAAATCSPGSPGSRPLRRTPRRRTTRSRRTTGAGWLADQVTDGLVHNDQFDFDDVGLSIDVALGLDAAGKKPTVVKAITKAVAKNVDAPTPRFPPSVYAGATAKAAVLALERRQGPEVVRRRRPRHPARGPRGDRRAGHRSDRGRLRPERPFGGDFANVIGQAYAASALSQAQSPKACLGRVVPAPAAVRQGLLPPELHRRQDATPTRPATGPRRRSGRPTPTRRPSRCSPSSTSKGAAAKAAVKKAVAWLVDNQGADGSFGGGTSHRAANTNSTGLAGWALAEAGKASRPRRAAVWVRTYQVGRANPCSGSLAKDVGAIAYDLDALRGGVEEGHHQEDERPVATGLRPGAARAPVGAARRRCR